jgi:Zn-dependent hydrolases, including glyoxylases
MKVTEISKGVYLHQSFHRTDDFGVVSANGLVVVENGKAFIIDTPWSDHDTEKLVDWVLEKNYKFLGSISTHSHEDRTAGIKWLNSHSIPTYATKLTNALLKSEKKELATYTLKENESNLADGMLEVFYPGGGHTIDNVVVWLPKSKILFGGCFTRSLESKGLGYTGEAYIEQWAGSAESVLKKYAEAEIVIPGHGKIGDLTLLGHTKSLVEAASNKSMQPTADASAD